MDQIYLKWETVAMAHGTRVQGASECSNSPHELRVAKQSWR